MPEPYGWDTIEQAEELYIIDGLTFDQVAERTGVSVSQLKRWSADSTPTWPERRREYRTAQVSVRRGVMLAKARLIESVIESEDPQKAYAFGALVSSGKQIEAEARERAAAQAVDQALQQPIGDLVAEVTDPIEALREAVRLRVAGLVQAPGTLTLAAVKELLQAMEMLERRAAPKATGGAGPVALTAEQLQAEIRKVYGV
jgi:transcriptional regulator with XRE-family HTH domain